MSPILLVLAGTLGATTVGCAAVLLRWSRARWSAAVLVVSGLLLLLGAVGASAGADPTVAWALAGYLGAPLAFVCYPRPAWRAPLTSVLAAAVLGAGGTALVWAQARDVCTIVLFVALVGHAWWTIERGGEDARRPMSWAALAWAGILLSSGIITFSAEAAGPGQRLWPAATVLLLVHLAPVALVLGAVRPDVVDVRAVTTSVVVTGAVLLTLFAVGRGAAAAFEWLTGAPLDQTGTVALCAVLAFGVQPLRVVLRGMIDRLLFGERPDPLDTATRLADRIGDDAALALDAVREALLLPYASLEVDDAEVAVSGVPVAHTRAIPLRLDDDSRGALVVGLRPGDFTLGAGDADVLRIVAPLLALALRHQRTAAELVRSRNGLLTAVEEERRRLRRDLHDGLGPRLTGVAFAADAASNFLASSPGRTAELLAGLRLDVAEAIGEIRRAIDGLRPAGLDELGLVGALREWSRHLRGADGRELDVRFDAPETIDVRAAVEVAAFRIVVEALTNVARHSGSATAAVRIAVTDDELLLEVTDSGRGGSWVPGVGITSMIERARQIGGDLKASSTPTGGRVSARLPLDA